MNKLTSPSRQITRLRRFCKALNQTANLLQHSAHSEATVLEVTSAQIHALGLQGMLTLLDDVGENLVIRALAQPFLGRDALGMSIPLARVSALLRVITRGKPSWGADHWKNLASFISPATQSAPRMPRQPGIYAPIILDGKPQGVLIVSAKHLTRADVSAIQALANHIAVALENARLYTALNQNQERFRAFIEQGSDLFLLLDAAGVIRYASPSISRLLGYTANRIVGKNVFRFIHPDDHTRAQSTFQHRLAHAGTTTTVLTVRVRHHDGTWRVFEATGNNLLDNPAINGILLSCRDVTDRARAEHQAHANQARLEAIFENIPFDFWVCDQHGRYIAQNAISIRHWGNVIGKHPTELDLPQEMVTAWAENNARARRGEVVTSEVVYTQNGEPRTFFKIVSPVRVGNEIQGSLGVNIDITERKRAENALRAREQHLAQLNEITRTALMISDFTTMAQTLADQLGAMFGADEVFITRWDAVRGMSIPFVAFGPQRETYRMLEVRPGEPSLTAAVLQAQHPIAVEDVFASPLISQRLAHQLPTRAMLGLPLMAGEQKIGGALIGYDRPHHFSDEEIARAEQVTHLLALALMQMQSLEQARAHAATLEAIRQASVTLTSSLDLKTVLTAILDGVLRLASDANDTHIFLYANDQLTFGAARYADGMRDTPWAGPRENGVTYTVARQGQPMIVNDTRTHPLYAGTSADWGGSLISLPLKIGARVVGVMNVAYWQPRMFEESFVHALQLLADQAALAIENARLYEAERTRAAELEVLRQATLRLTASLDLPSVLDSILDSVFQLMPTIQDAHIFLYHADTLTFGAARTSEGKLTQPFAQPRRDGLTYTVAQSGKTVIVPDQQNHPLFANAPADWRGAIIGLPLKIGTQVVSVMNIAFAEPRTLTESQVQILELLGDQAALAIQNARLFEAEREARTQSDTLRQAAQVISSSLNRSEILHRILTQLQRVIPCTTTSVLLYDQHGTPDLIAGMGYTNALVTNRAAQNLLRDSRILTRLQRDLQPVLIPDVRKNPDWIWVPGAEHVIAFLGVPIIAQQKMIGVLFLDRDTPNAFSPTELQLAQTFAQHLAVPLENARLFEESEQRAREFAALYETARDLAGETDLPRLLETIAMNVRRALNAQNSVIYLYDAANKELITAANDGASFPLGTRHQIAQGVSGIVVRTRQPVIVDDYQHCEYRRAEYADLPIGAVAEVPILSRDALIGVLGVAEFASSARKFNQDDVRLLLLFASQAASAWRNAKLVSETQRRLVELEAVNRISATLRTAQTVDEMVPLFLEQAAAALETVQISLWLYDPARDLLYQQGTFGNVRAKYTLKLDESIAGHVFRSGEPYVSKEFKTDPLTADISRPFLPLGRNGACVPVRAGTEPIGVMFASVDLPRVFSTENVRLLMTLAEIAGNAIHRMRLYAQTTQRANDLAVVNQLGHQLSATRDLGTIYARTAAAVRQVLPDTSAVIISLCEPERDQVIWTYGIANGKPINVHALTPLRLESPEHDPQTQAIRTRRSVIVNNPISGSQSASLVLESDIASPQSVVHVPLLAQENVIGTIQVHSLVPHRFSPSDAELLELIAHPTAGAIENARLFAELEHAYDQTIEGWARALDLRDRETEGHTRRVVEKSVELARALGVPEDQIAQIRRGALLHDIGKMGIPDAILLKPGPLTESEWETMRMHPAYAYALLSSIEYLRDALDIPYCHHERWNGTGYPRGLKGEEIPLAARLFAIVDVWDALCSNRTYRAAWPSEKALAYLREHAGIYFDPAIVEVFIKLEHR